MDSHPDYDSPWKDILEAYFPEFMAFFFADALVDNPSPFAVVVMAHLKMLATRRDPEVRYDWKFTLFKMLYERGYSRKDILELWRFIDWLVFLPADLEDKLEVAVMDFEREKTMRYVTNIERSGERRGRREAMHENILDVLAIRFGSVPEDVRTWVTEIEEIEVLKEVLHTAVTAPSLAEFIHTVKPK